jgi:hypothetical protein
MLATQQLLQFRYVLVLDLLAQVVLWRRCEPAMAPLQLSEPQLLQPVWIERADMPAAEALRLYDVPLA